MDAMIRSMEFARSSEPSTGRRTDRPMDRPPVQVGKGRQAGRTSASGSTQARWLTDLLAGGRADGRADEGTAVRQSRWKRR